MVQILTFFSLWGPPVLWAFIIFRFSSGPVPQASSLYWPNFAFMKGAHAFFYGILALLLYRAYLGIGLPRKKSALLAFWISVLYGVSDEFHQMFTQTREARVRDVFFDAFGAGVFLYIIYKYYSRLPKTLRKLFGQFGVK